MTEQTQGQIAEEPEYAPAWKPEPNTRIKGVVLEIKAIDPNGQGAYPCVNLRTAEGDVSVHAFHSVLRRELARRAPKVGDEIEIAYLGKKAGGRGDAYHNYKVVGGQAAEFDWAQELPPEERAPHGLNPNGTWAVEPPIPPAPISQTNPADVQFVPEPQPTVQERAAESYGDKPPF